MIIEEGFDRRPGSASRTHDPVRGRAMATRSSSVFGRLSRVEFDWTDAMVYPLFHRLGRLRYLTTEWRVLAEGRRRNYYTITDRGRAALARRQRRWLAVIHALSGMSGGSGWLLAASASCVDRLSLHQGGTNMTRNSPTDPPSLLPSGRRSSSSQGWVPSASSARRGTPPT